MQELGYVQGVPDPSLGHRFECGMCGAVLKVQVHERTTICPYCDAPAVVERPGAAVALPSFALGFVVAQEQAHAFAHKWIKSRWFARSDFLRAPIDKTRGVYLPAYLYGAVARSRYSADIGENYTETETYVTRDPQGKMVTRTRTVVKTEWRSLHGEHACYVRDVVVTASRSLPNDALERIEPFDLRALKRYDPAVVSGWNAEEPSLEPQACGELARAEAMAKVGAALAAFMPGDSYRNLQHWTQPEAECLELLLLPIWVLAVRYHPEKPPARVLVNGQTGKVGGDVPRSAVKITLAVLACIALVLIPLLVLATQ
jgi:hypothetical protein